MMYTKGQVSIAHLAATKQWSSNHYEESELEEQFRHWAVRQIYLRYRDMGDSFPMFVPKEFETVFLMFLELAKTMLEEGVICTIS